MFKFYPKLYYKVNDFDYLKVSDINFYAKIKDYMNKFGQVNARSYTVVNGDAPAIVSYKIYESPQFEYIILLLNDIRNIYDEWPRSNEAFADFIVEKYGSVNYAKTNYIHYHTASGAKVSETKWYEITDTDKYFESYYDYEDKLNTEKAKIKVLSYEMAVRFEVELQHLINELKRKNTNV